ncbi:hypothetical protein [Hoylesella oralis]|uniref:hypothetical protein n=1 Tax=Hoylesella oralis TaxID=28134 RepID=UPI0028E9F316|nr:hypothetical protein [Hoylesella oralis]
MMFGKTLAVAEVLALLIPFRVKDKGSKVIEPHKNLVKHVVMKGNKKAIQTDGFMKLTRRIFLLSLYIIIFVTGKQFFENAKQSITLKFANFFTVTNNHYQTIQDIDYLPII